MSPAVLKQMCEEIISELKECIDVVEEDGSISRDWSDKIFEIYKMVCF